jgi:hypothetical protein
MRVAEARRFVNQYVIQPINTWVVQPINRHVVQPALAKIKSFYKAPRTASPIARTGKYTEGGGLPGIYGKNLPTREVPLSQLEHGHPPPSLPEHFQGKPYLSIAERAAQLRQSGIDTGSAVRLPDGRIIVTGGNSRLAAMRELGQESMPLKVLDWNKLDPEVKGILRQNYPGLRDAP